MTVTARSASTGMQKNFAIGLSDATVDRSGRASAYCTAIAMRRRSSGVM